MTSIPLDGLLPDHYEGDRAGEASIVDELPLGKRAALVVAETPHDLFAVPVVTGVEVVRARPTDRVAIALLELLASDAPSHDGAFDIVRLTARSVRTDADERAMLVDQTHESVVVGNRAVVKWAVRAEPTPAPTLVAHLAAAGFRQMATPWGFVTWARGDERLLLASVVDYLEGASDGWTWAVADAGDFATGRSDGSTATAAMRPVGELVADLHACLATDTAVIASPARASTPADAEQWERLAVSLLAEATSTVDGIEGERLREHADVMRSCLETIASVESTITIPVHGDLHVGQVLRWDGGYAVGDFDGNPVLSPDERLAPQPAARDVAGMLQSIDHVGRVVNRRVDGADASRVDEWIAQAQSTFLEAYRSRLGQLGVQQLFDARLVLPFQVEQECREFLYAVRHLPRWRYVPDQALAALMERVATES
ncbi:MAG TPA: aminoglycoside phosphotransferase [Actinomycetes bacterium]|nr:aminoglycoside phosphotransferase [Actinomycetes bacterium]